MAHKILGVDCTLPACAGRLLDRKPGIFGPALIYKCVESVRQRGESHRRNCFHNVPQMLFLTLQSTNTPPIKYPKERNKSRDARRAEPVSLVVGGDDIQNNHSFRPVPQSLAVAGEQPESIGAGPKVRV